MNLFFKFLPAAIIAADHHNRSHISNGFCFGASDLFIQVDLARV